MVEKLLQLRYLHQFLKILAYKEINKLFNFGGGLGRQIEIVDLEGSRIIYKVTIIA